MEEEWRDEFSRQDLNGDAIITLEESQETLFRALVAQSNAISITGSRDRCVWGSSCCSENR